MQHTHLITLVLLGVLAVSGCSASRHVNPVAKKLDVDGLTTKQYHYLAETPHGEGLAHEGYIVALEKAPRYKIDHSGTHSYEKRFRFYRDNEGNEDQRTHLRNAILDNSKAMFVSHIVAYEADRREPVSSHVRAHASQPRIRTRFLYNIYPDAGARTYSSIEQVPIIQANDNYYENGWRALEESLYIEVTKKLAAARDADQPYTHLLFGAMGWDNDQAEAVRRYNAIVSQVIEQSRRDLEAEVAFNPLVIGITWPSVWGWFDYLDTIRLLYKLSGYGVKANDADEIGYTYANWLVNKLGMDMRESHTQEPRLRVVAFGHSFGARLVSRAVFSRDLLRDQPTGVEQSVDLLIGLQGAFSVNRFIQGKGNEGYPYAGLPHMGGLTLMTTSENDKANPLAHWITRSPHIGGERGLGAAIEAEQADETQGAFQLPTMTDRHLSPQECGTRDRVLLVDSSAYVSDHNDVLNKEVGELLWSAVRCVSQ